MYELQCAQVDFSNKTRVLLPVSSLAFVGREGGGCTHRCVCTHTHTHEACSFTNKVTKLVRTNEEVSICTVPSYKQTIIIPFGENASVPRSSSGKLASGWINSSSKLGLRWSAEADPPMESFPETDTLLYLQKPEGQSAWALRLIFLF